MNTLRAAIVPGLIAGIVSIFTSWFWMGLVFHRYQRATPETWRPEGPRNYALSSLVRVLSAIAISALYVLVARFHVGFFADGMVGALRFAALIWIALSAPVAIEAAIYVRMFHQTQTERDRACCPARIKTAREFPQGGTERSSIAIAK